ncbi:asparagine synthase (glutamine-hydrolyzing) [Sporomusa sphaeroides]|uniref:asparagine synthase (glutamine-hydrolyzing) n=1 Tax=Sporomusa sphaeroides TaxID=47679 RepID=UPI002C96E6F6|nr:asparagine synthase (glutamine-hydrolyzing) [Sporomusa sphaeroides]HML34174.1 asparagine synthase (glutamine-hydrolyzing) [Sporomusa sphaeroides]
MCGIWGVLARNSYDISIAKQALNLLYHRGPDQYGEWYDSKVYLGHRRLSILDTSENGKQPMMANDVVITVNGEIYNFRTLKKELIKNNFFKSDSDSEVVLHGYHEWGIDELVKRIDGMYAICIYDLRKQKIYLIRDRVGIKPLYFGDNGNQVVWSSELQSIVEYYGEDQLSIDYTAIYDYLTYLYIPAPKTMYKNIYKLKPAHYVEIDLNSLKYESYQYWKLETKEIKIEVNEAAYQLYKLIDKSVDEQLMSDVPIGFFLSGGLDSSVVVATASNKIKHLVANTIGFNDKEHDEIQYAKIVADKFQADHNVEVLNSINVSDNIHKMKEWYIEPFADTSAFPSYLVSEYTRKSCTVALTGDGGDEVFGGYNWYKKFEKIKKIQTLPFPLSLNSIKNLKRKYTSFHKYLNKLEYFSLTDDLELYARLMGGLIKHEKQDYKKSWGIDDFYDDYWYFRQHYKTDIGGLKRLQYLDFHTYLPDDILTKVDRVSMRVSLEARVPLLSKEIIEYMFSLPNEIIYHNGELKGLLKYAYKDILPQKIINRDKRGFSIPYTKWKRDLSTTQYATKQEMILREQYSSIIKSV